MIMSPTSQPNNNNTELLTKSHQQQKQSSLRRRFLRPWFLFHRRLGTIVIALPIIWYALSGTLMGIARDFKLGLIYHFLQKWHSFQPLNRLTHQLINGLVSLSILALFISGIIIWRWTKKNISKKTNKTLLMRKFHSLLSPVFGAMGVIFAISGWTNVCLSHYSSESMYQLSRAVHNGSWLHYTWLHCSYNIIGGIGLMIVAITGLLSRRQDKTLIINTQKKKSQN